MRFDQNNNQKQSKESYNSQKILEQSFANFLAQ